MSFPGPLPIVPGDDATFWENQGTSSSSALMDSSPRKASWRKGDCVCVEHGQARGLTRLEPVSSSPEVRTPVPGIGSPTSHCTLGPPCIFCCLGANSLLKKRERRSGPWGSRLASAFCRTPGQTPKYISIALAALVTLPSGVTRLPRTNVCPRAGAAASSVWKPFCKPREPRRWSRGPLRPTGISEGEANSLIHKFREQLKAQNKLLF